MAQAEASRQRIHPRVREEVESQATTIEALTFSATPSQAEVEALRDAVAAALRAAFGATTS